jgi:hypothetical protein
MSERNGRFVADQKRTSKFSDGGPYSLATADLADNFDRNTLSDMEIAFECGCQVLAVESDKHAARRHIASRIIECAQAGERTLTGLTQAACVAATELCVTHGA